MLLAVLADVLQLTGLQAVRLLGNVVYKQVITAVTLDLVNTQEHLDIHGSVMTLVTVTVTEL